MRLAENSGERACTWCGAMFTLRGDGGSPKKFCSAACRKDFHVGCRVWAEDQVLRGVVSVESLKRAVGQRVR